MAILSIQSHVVYGCVGNSAAVFPMQRMGYEVWAINTVEFSNHTGYGAWRGDVLSAKLVDELVCGLEDRCILNRCNAVLSGYLGDPKIGSALGGIVQKVKSKNPHALYCCDPVMGDVDTGLYVSKDIPKIFAENLMPLADIVTPNQFELETICKTDTSTIEGALYAINILHDMGPSIVLVTSYNEKNSDDAHISMIASCRTLLGKCSIEYITTPRIPFKGIISGCGDLTSAVFLAEYLSSACIKTALEKTASSVFGVLKNTYELQANELQLTQSQEEFIHPANCFKCKTLATHGEKQ
ncbi:MAG: pyridoxal kinase [Termitinemataceae bacterium]|nr:MAG: pyridoxal kinase [Termitinemataceae bacterium]